MEGSAIWNYPLREILKAIDGKESAGDYYYYRLRRIFKDKLTGSARDNADKINGTPHRSVFGMEDHKKLLFSKIFNTDEKPIQFSVLPIVGVCGSGKTTLARLVYEDGYVEDQFGVRAWVRVDGAEVKPREAAEGILKSAMGMSCSVDDPDELDEMVRDTLQFQRCLIVFDGIEFISTDSWLYMIKHWFDFVDLGSVVLITTCREQVAYVVDRQPFELTPLSVDAAWSMCRHLVYYNYEENHLATPLMAKNVAALCNGNPLSLRLLASLMRSHKGLQKLLSSVDFSHDMLPPPPDASAVVLLCVWALPRHLRQCLVYCSTYPKGYALNKQKIAGMLFEYLDGYKYTADYYLDQLISKSFFTDITYDKNHDIMEFRMPGIIHKIAQDVARLAFEVEVGIIGAIREDAGTLSYSLPFLQEYNPERLQLLILSPTIYLGGVLDHSLAEFTDLRSLDLSCTGIRTLSGDIWALRELRYLNLSYSLIESLPDSVTDLLQLQTLDLSWCYHLKVLPEKIHRLNDMIHLDLSRCESLPNLPSGIACLHHLTSMPLFVLGKDGDCACLEDLGNLDRLRGRLEIRNLENVRDISEAKGANLISKHLDHLVLSWGSEKADGCFEILQLLKPNRRLKVLDLTGYVGSRFPHWVSFMNSLIKISISECKCEKLPSLGQLRRLKELQLKGMRYIEFIGQEFYGEGIFPSLEQLGIYDLPMLLEWSSALIPDSSSVFPRLQTLTVEGCPQLGGLPSNILHLRHLTICNSNSQILDYLTKSPVCSSVLINDMKLGMSSNGFRRLRSLETLTLFNINDELIDDHLVELANLPCLKHLGIIHCHQLRVISWPSYTFLRIRKVHISDCQNLRLILGPAPVSKLVVEACPQALTIFKIGDFGSLNKLIIKECSEFDISYDDLKYLKKLECLLVSGCPKLEKRLQEEPLLISCIPFVILGNRKISAPTPAADSAKHDKMDWKMKPMSLVTSSVDRPSFGSSEMHEDSESVELAK